MSWTLKVFGPTVQPLPSTSMNSCTFPSGSLSPALIVMVVVSVVEKSGVGKSGRDRCDAAEGGERDTTGDERAADPAVDPAKLLHVVHDAQHTRGKRGVERHHDHVDDESGGREDRVDR